MAADRIVVDHIEAVGTVLQLQTMAAVDVGC